MKKALYLLPTLFMVIGCGNQPSGLLPPISEDAKIVKLTKANCGLTNDDSTEEFEVTLDIENSTEKYEILVGPNCYAHSKYEEFLIKKNGYIKSKSTFQVDRLIIDYMSKKGANFKVYSGENLVSPYNSTYQTEYPAQDDYGAVLEYPINGTSWTISNDSDYKPAFYSVRVVFTL